MKRLAVAAVLGTAIGLCGVAPAVATAPAGAAATAGATPHSPIAVTRTAATARRFMADSRIDHH